MDKLTIIQILGILLSGVGGILATFAKTQTEDKTHLTKKGWLTISLIFVGIALGLIGQVIANNESEEQTSKVLKNLTAQAEQNNKILTILEKQGVLSQQTLDDIEKFLTPIDDRFTVNAIYEVPATDNMPEANTSVAQLQDYFDQCISGYTNFGHDSTIGAMDVDWLRHAQTKPGTQPAKIFLIRLDQFLQEFPTNSETKGIRQLLTSFKNPNFNVALSKEPCAGTNFGIISTTSPFIVEADSLKASASNTFIYYAQPSRRIFVHWQYDFPKDKWFANGKKISLHDVANAYCYAQLNWYAGYPNPMRPILVDLQFDRYPSATLYNFKSTDDKSVFENVLPSENEIFGGRASRFTMPFPLVSELYPP